LLIGAMVLLILAGAAALGLALIPEDDTVQLMYDRYAEIQIGMGAQEVTALLGRSDDDWGMPWGYSMYWHCPVAIRVDLDKNLKVIGKWIDRPNPWTWLQRFLGFT
jgi:hypothetical protein